MSTKSFSDELKLNSTVDTTTKAVSFYGNVLTNVARPYLTVQSYLDSGNGLYDLPLFNGTIDVCMLLNNDQYEPLIQVLMRLLKKRSGVVTPSRCPIPKVFRGMKWFRLEIKNFHFSLCRFKEAVFGQRSCHQP